jgi:hypothetical protein
MKITRQMILLSYERQCFSRTNTFGTPTACIRFAILSRIETLHILLEHPYDSSATSRLSSPTSSAAASREKPGSCSVRSGSSSVGSPSVDPLHTSSRGIQASYVAGRQLAPGSQAFSGRSAPDQPKVPWRESQSSRR